MTSPKVFIEEQMALRADIASRMEALKKHIAQPGSGGAVGIGRNYEDVTEATVADMERQIAEIDARIESIRSGNT